MSMITSTDVARRAGVSQSAVSRVFTPGASASPATKAKVLQAASESRCRPDPPARAMTTGQSRIVGLSLTAGTAPHNRRPARRPRSAPDTSRSW
jgi:DNA-binding LacI/PurR family transcriptional regulator